MSQFFTGIVKLSKCVVFIGLFIYFAVRVITSVEKLQKKEILQ